MHRLPFISFFVMAVGMLLASGLINSWNLPARPRDLVATDFGRLVLLKIGLFAAMVTIAAVNRFHLTPRLAAPTAQRALQRNSLGETGLGLCVLVLVGCWGPWRHPRTSMSAPID